MKRITAGKVLDLFDRSHSVIQESEGADEHAELLKELAEARALVRACIDASHMGTGAEVVVIDEGDEPFDDLLHTIGPRLQAQSDGFVGWSFEYPGHIALRTDGGGLWNIGTANGTWGADLYVDEQSFIDGESPDHTVITDVPGDNRDADRIVKALYGAMSTLGS